MTLPLLYCLVPCLFISLLITWERTSPDMQIVMEHMFIYTMMLYGVSLCFTARSCSALCIWSSFCDETISISYDCLKT
ncbi:hypothetical protein Godav_002211 [Gossypium davidsonii]|uniref:Uncharacterized protein n=1 Tax=Gossypium davidsonii TaxID=34287 RepID=A0A7J8SVF8_GOSDV|nr:hypothetical protein [Gossypium davidsonii]